MTRELVPVQIGDRMRDNDPRCGEIYGGERVLQIVEVNAGTVRAAEVLRDATVMERCRQYDRSRIYPAGTVRRSGFTLLPKDQS